MPRQRQQIDNAVERHNTPDHMKILSAETYNDAAAVSIARSLTELAQQRPGQSSYTFGISGGFEVIRERRADMAQPKVQKIEEKGTKARKPRKTRRANPSEDEDAGRRRKKQKLSEDEDGDEDEASKKSRGRPRMDTKDETAADVGLYAFLVVSLLHPENDGSERHPAIASISGFNSSDFVLDY
jgi:hypothetical protein